MFNKSTKTFTIIIFAATIVIIFSLKVFKTQVLDNETKYEESIPETDSVSDKKFTPTNTEPLEKKELISPDETSEKMDLLTDNNSKTAEDIFLDLELPNPVEDLEIEIMLNDVQLRQLWKAQDNIMNSWPDYLDIRESLYKELSEKFDLNNLSNEDIINTALNLRRQFWQAGGNRSHYSFRYAYMARILLELAHNREPENLAITDELVETIQSTSPIWTFDNDLSKKSDNNDMIKLLSKLRSSQFELIKTKVEQGHVPDWNDFVRANDLAYLLGKSKDYESAKKVTKWLIHNSGQGRWTAYLDTLEKSLNELEREDILKFNIYIVADPHLPKEFEYTRRLPSFKGPDWKKRGLTPVHERTPTPVWLSKEDLLSQIH